MPSLAIPDFSLGNYRDNLLFPDDPDELFVREHLQELVADEQEVGTFGGAAGAEVELTYLVPYPQLYACLQFLNGLDYVQTVGGVDLLRRIPPAAHPWFDNLRCVGAAVTGLLVDAEDGAVKTRPARDVVNPSREKAAVYTRARIRAKYAVCTYHVGDDAEMPADGTGEYVRFTEFSQSSLGISMLAAESLRQLRFTEAPFTTAPPVSAPFGTLKFENTLKVFWRRVPRTWVCEKYLKMTRLDRGQGCLNSEEFLGHPPGTLLFEGYTTDERHYEINVVDPALPAVNYDVTLNFRAFDPENAVEGSPHRGHNLQPVKNGGQVGWAYAVDDQGDPLFGRSMDFADLFKSAKNPD